MAVDPDSEDRNQEKQKHTRTAEHLCVQALHAQRNRGTATEEAAATLSGPEPGVLAWSDRRRPHGGEPFAQC